MPEVRCAICNRKVLPSRAYRCNNCEIWICQSCVSHGGILGTYLACPKCSQRVK